MKIVHLKGQTVEPEAPAAKAVPVKANLNPAYIRMQALEYIRKHNRKFTDKNKSV